MPNLTILICNNCYALVSLSGSLLALTTCLADIDNILSAVQRQSKVDGVDYVGTILNRAMNLAKSVILHVLLVMVPKNKQNILGKILTFVLFVLFPQNIFKLSWIF